MARETLRSRLVSLLLVTITIGLNPVRVFAQAVSWGGCVVNDVATIQCLVPLFKNAVMAVVEFAGIALFFMFIVGGFSFITSGGNPKQLEQARNTLTYAIIGLVVVVIAFLIIQLISAITGVSGLNQFTIPDATP